MSKRLATALAAFAALGVVASFVLHGTPLLVVLILFGLFAVKSLIAEKIRAQREPEENTEFQSGTQELDSESEVERLSPRRPSNIT
jgi:hypothetical protein